MLSLHQILKFTSEGQKSRKNANVVFVRPLMYFMVQPCELPRETKSCKNIMLKCEVNEIESGIKSLKLAG